MTSSIPRIPISWVVPQGQCPVLALRRDDVGLQVAHARGLDCCCVQRHVLLRRAREGEFRTLSWYLFCESCVASRTTPPVCFLLLPPPFSAPGPVYCGPPGPLHGPCFPVPPVPTGPPCSVRLLYAVSLLVSMSTLQRPSLVLCLVYTNTTAAAAWCAACSLLCSGCGASDGAFSPPGCSNLLQLQQPSCNRYLHLVYHVEESCWASSKQFTSSTPPACAHSLPARTHAPLTLD